jgi:hypothetical protein
MSLSMYVAARDRGEPARDSDLHFAGSDLGYMYVRTDSMITKPSDLVGKRIGTDGYRYTINLWLRGLLKEYYGFSPEQATWVTSDVEGAGYVVPQGIPVEIRKGSTPVEKRRRRCRVIWCPCAPKSSRTARLDPAPVPDCRRGASLRPADWDPADEPRHGHERGTGRAEP